ncbi:MAG: LamG domain-containing protein [Nanoarchaeota archaeon]
MNKRGMSEIITTLIIILVSLVAITAVWVVVKNVINSGSQEISLGKFTINLELQKVVINPGSLDVIVKRNVGTGDIKSFKFIVSGGPSSQTFSMPNPGLNELETKTFTLPYTGIVKEISILPILDSGTSGSAITKTYTENEMLQNLGLVSWWRMENNLQDSVGANSGTPQGGGVSYQTGKFGQAVNLTSSSYISVPDSLSLNPQNGITIAAWENSQSGDYPIVGKTNYTNGVFLYGYQLTYGPGKDLHFRIASSDLGSAGAPGSNWIHVVATYDESMMILYADGVSFNTNINTNNILDSTDPLEIGHSVRGPYFFNGKIDEVMIFDRALTAQQVQGLYNYSFS